MSEFRGVQCDKCGAVIPRGESTRRNVKVDGPEVHGQYDEDLCSACVVIPEGVTLRPLRRRDAHTVTPAHT